MSEEYPLQVWHADSASITEALGRRNHDVLLDSQRDVDNVWSV
jgi:hypothetical protein